MASDVTKRMARNAQEQLIAALAHLNQAIEAQSPVVTVPGGTFPVDQARTNSATNVRAWASNFASTIGSTACKAAGVAAQQIEAGNLDDATRTLLHITIPL
jgi:hypothetical protein